MASDNNSSQQNLEDMLQYTVKNMTNTNAQYTIQNPPKDVAVNNEDPRQMLFRRRLWYGSEFGEMNTAPLNRNYNEQFGYPPVISKQAYQLMYDRDPVAHRIVQLYPLECWQQVPQILDSDAPTQSDFEKQIHALFQKFNIWAMLRRIDILSGIGRYGILLMGVNDGKKLSDPIDLTDEKGNRKRYQLLYMRAFPHSQVSVVGTERDSTNPRYGHPVMYQVQFHPTDIMDMDMDGFTDFSMQMVHWTRVIHIADNRDVSELYGIPRLQLVYNDLLNLYKVVGCAGESFYKVAFPAFAIEASDTMLNSVDIDIESLRAEIARFENNSQRWMALKNAHITPISASYSDPASLIEQCMKRIAVGLGCPVRILEGSERGELASSQDAVIWKKRLMERQQSYITPFIIKPVVQYLIRYGMVDMPFNRDFHVEWEDLSSDTQADIYEIRSKQLELFRAWKDSEMSKYISIKDFFIKFLDMNDNEVTSLLENADQFNREQVEKEASEMYKKFIGSGDESESAGEEPGGMGGGFGF